MRSGRLNSVDVSGDRVPMMRLMEAAENAKVELSYASHADICVQYIAATTSFPIHLSIALTRAYFEEIVYHLIERARIICQNCLKNAEIVAKKIDDVILVGGMARVPCVQQIVVEIFRKAPNVEVDSLEAVVVGAAIQGGFIIEDEKEPQLPNVIPLSVGIETLGGVCMKINNRNSRIPTKASRTLSTESDNQKSICLRILLGEPDMSTDNKLLEELEFIGIPPAPQGIPRIVVTFDIDANSVLSVSAKSKDTGIERTIRVKSVIETEKYAKKVVKVAVLNGKRDEEKSVLIEVKNAAVCFINKIEKFLLVKKKVIPVEDCLEIEAALTGLRVAMDSDDMFVIISKINAAENAGLLVRFPEDAESECDSDDIL